MQFSKKNYRVKVYETAVLVWWGKKAQFVQNVNVPLWFECHRCLRWQPHWDWIDRAAPPPRSIKRFFCELLTEPREVEGCILPGHSADANTTVWWDTRGASVTVYQKPNGQGRGLGEGLLKIAIQRGLVNGGSSAGLAWKAISHVSSIIHAVSVSVLARLGM